VKWADEDYMAAWSLLLDGSVLQGSVLSNTAIEKYLKGALLVRGGGKRERTHNIVYLYESLK
jgi:HEPN domain-containing protein